MSLPTLPRDLIKEIFSYLPVKPLVRFTSVSKHYKSLIFNPEFIKLHLHRSPKHAHVLLTLHDAVKVEESWEEIWVLTPCSVRHLLQHPPSIGNEDECRRFNDSYYTIGKNLLLPAGFDEVLHDETELAVLRGCLCLYYDHMRTHFVLWEMKEFGVQDSWTQLVNVSYVHLQFDNIQHDWLLVPVCLLENEHVLLLVSKEVPDDVIMYNWRDDDRVEHIELPGDNQIWYADGHMQSLVVPLPHPH